MPSAGDTIRLSSSIDIGFLNYEETGNNFTWDFSTMMPYAQNVDTFVSTTQTPWTYQLIFFGSANLAQSFTEFDQLPGFQVTDIYYFYKNSSSDFREAGYGVTLNGIPLPNKYAQPDIIYHFPLEAGNIDSSYSTHEIAIPGLGYSGGWKKRVNHADGWGTLITPYGSFQTLRVKSEVEQYDSLYIDSLGFGLPLYRAYIEYKWLGEGFGLPLCKVTDDGLLPTISYIDSVRTFFVSMDERSIENDISVFPNPVKNELNIKFELKKPSLCKVELYDLNGQLLFELGEEEIALKSISKSYHLDRMQINPGIYMIIFQIDNHTVIKKIVVL